MSKYMKTYESNSASLLNHLATKKSNNPDTTFGQMVSQMLSEVANGFSKDQVKLQIQNLLVQAKFWWSVRASFNSGGMAFLISVSFVVMSCLISSRS